MKVLVTGCAGFIGSHLTERLLNDGYEVIGVDSFDNYYPRSLKEKNLLNILLHPKFRFFEANLATAPMAQFWKGVEAVFHLAAQPGVRASWGALFSRYLQNNVSATQRLLEEAKGRKIKKFIYASSSSVYGEAEGALSENRPPAPISPYGVTKLAAEHLCLLYHREMHVPAVGLRFFSVYGPRQRPDMAFQSFCRAILEDAPITLYGGGDQRRDFTYVGDIVEILVRALDAPVEGEVLNAGCGRPVPLKEALELLEALCGRKVHRRVLERAKGDVFSTWADTSRLAEKLRFVPQTDLQKGLQAQWEWAAAEEREQEEGSLEKNKATQSEISEGKPE